MRGLIDSIWQTMGIPSALTPIGHLHQSPPSLVPEEVPRVQSPVSRNSNIERRMDRPKSVVGVISLWGFKPARGESPLNSLDALPSPCPHNSGPIQWRRGDIGPPPRAPTVSGGKKLTSAPTTPIRRLPGDSAPLNVINTAVTRGGYEIHSKGGGPQGPIPIKKKHPRKKSEGENCLGRGPKSSPWRTTVLNLVFKP